MAVEDPLLVEVEGVLFDLDGVLVDSGTAVEDHWRAFADRHGIDVAELLAVAHGRRGRDTIALLLPHVDLEAEVAWMDELEITDVAGHTAVPGAAELLAALPEDRWAIVTSCGRRLAPARLGAVGLPVPERLVTADDVPQGKPAPDGYLQGLALLGADPARALVFEDAPSGLAAATAAGIRPVALTTTYPAAELDAEVHLADLRQVRVAEVRDATVLLELRPS